ncbi:MAG: hypothetical protein LBM25_04695 [Bacteroidales bacterium]|jgi:hypothetical protein|nr:hypothetical protein [Bacteroidales bacterium]
MNKLNRLELIIGGTSICLATILHLLSHDGFSILTLAVGYITLIVFFIKNIKQHFFWDKKPLLTIFALYYKTYMYAAIAFFLANFYGKDIIMLVFSISCILYMIISSLVKPSKKEIITAFIYLLVGGIFYSYSFFVA